jgi:hypothetical protein
MEYVKFKNEFKKELKRIKIFREKLKEVRQELVDKVKKFNYIKMDNDESIIEDVGFTIENDKLLINGRSILQKNTCSYYFIEDKNCNLNKLYIKG